MTEHVPYDDEHLHKVGQQLETLILLADDMRKMYLGNSDMLTIHHHRNALMKMHQ